MGLIDSLRGFLSAKAPSFLLTESSPNYYNTRANDSTNYLDQYEGWTYLAANLKAKAVLEYTPILMQTRGQNYEEAPMDTPILKDLYRFNEYQDLSEARYLKELHLALTGTAFWLMVESDTPKHKVDFYVVNPTKVEIAVDEYGLPKHYTVQSADGTKNNVPLGNMIYFKSPDPRNWLKGYGPLQASRYAHNTNEMAQKFNMSLMSNNGRPDVLFVADGLDKPNQDRLQSWFNQTFKGVENARKTGVINKEIKAIELGTNPKDLEFVKGQEMTMKQILALHGVPIDLVGLGGSTYANASEAQRYFQRYTIKPQLELEASVLNEQLLKYYYGPINHQLKFVADNPVEVDEAALSNKITGLYNNGLITLNEARAELNIEAIEGGDTIKEEYDYAPLFEDQEKKISSLSLQLKALKNDTNKDERTQLKAMYLEKDIKNEVDFRGTAIKFFDQQLVRVVDALVRTKAVNMRLDLDKEGEIEEAKKTFRSQYQNNANKYNQIANDLTGGNIVLDEEASKQIENLLTDFSKEFNETTSKDLKKIIAENIRSGSDLEQTKQNIIDLFTNYSEGAANVDVLKKYGVFVDKASIGTDGKVVIASTNRYNEMLEKITKTLTGPEQEEAMKALYGVIDPSDPVGQSVKSTMELMFDIKGPVVDVIRVEKIARTEINKIKNYTTRKNYFENPYVEGFEWLSAHDQYTRDAHADADGQIAKKGVKFLVWGERLAYPGDPSGSAKNVINCRCTIAPVVSDDL